MSCIGCKDGILNGQDSLFPDPICNECQETEVVCTGISTYTDCIKVNTALPCLETANEVSLTSVLEAIDAKLCQNQESTCTVSVSATDDCCGYLEDKITNGVGTTVTKPSERICETLQVDINNYTYTSVTPNFLQKWVNSPGLVNLAVGTNGTDVIRLKGHITNGSLSALTTVAATLPIDFRPTELKVFTSLTFVTGLVILWSILISPNGEISVTPNIQGTTAGKTWTLSLDFINFTK